MAADRRQIQMSATRSPASGDVRVTGHLQVRARAGDRKWYAHCIDRDGIKRTKMLRPAHVQDSGRRTLRGLLCGGRATAAVQTVA